jgi:hypothetical protein
METFQEIIKKQAERSRARSVKNRKEPNQIIKKKYLQKFNNYGLKL